jgi:hypothetical protein
MCTAALSKKDHFDDRNNKSAFLLRSQLGVDRAAGVWLRSGRQPEPIVLPPRRSQTLLEHSGKQDFDNTDPNA